MVCYYIPARKYLKEMVFRFVELKLNVKQSLLLIEYYGFFAVVFFSVAVKNQCLVVGNQDQEVFFF